MPDLLALQSLVKPKQLAALLGVDRSTLHRWTVEDPKLRGCVFRRGYYSVQKLRDAGILTKPTTEAK
jgi:predicted site-specific integrase-resolvase